MPGKSGKELPIRRQEALAQDACAGGRQTKLFFQKAGKQRGIQVQLLCGRQAELHADTIPCGGIFHLRDVILELHDLFALFAVLFHRGAFQRVILFQHSRCRCRVGDLVAGKGDEVSLHLHRAHMGDADAGAFSQILYFLLIQAASSQ